MTFSFFSFFILISTSTYLPLLAAKAAKQQLTNGPLFNTIKEAFEAIGITRFKIYQTPSNGSMKMYSNYTVLLFKDLVQSLNNDELQAIIYHDAYHIKEKHMLKKIIGALLGFIIPVILFVTITRIISLYENDYVMYLQLFFAILMLLSFGVLLIKGIRACERQEMAADLFAVKQSENKNVVISALTKIATINKKTAIVTIFGIKFLSLEDRIKHIQST
jgi:Zn-dependent protease with chaperone function